MKEQISNVLVIVAMSLFTADIFMGVTFAEGKTKSPSFLITFAVINFLLIAIGVLYIIFG